MRWMVEAAARAVVVSPRNPAAMPRRPQQSIASESQSSLAYTSSSFGLPVSNRAKKPCPTFRAESGAGWMRNQSRASRAVARPLTVSP